MSEVDIGEVRGWAREGGAIARRYFNRVVGRRKADRSWVTQADIEIEQLLSERIAASYPDHGIMGEEQGLRHHDQEFIWCLDPLDGTGAFVAGLPVWGVSIGLLRAGKPYLGVIYLPLMDECYWADAEGPAFWDETPLQVSDATSFDNGDWIAGPSRAHRNYTISFPGKMRSLGSIASYFCYVARGSAIGALLGKPNLWDIAAGMAILHGAGGVSVLLSGAPIDTGALLEGQSCPEPVILSTPQLVDQLCSYIEVRGKG